MAARSLAGRLAAQGRSAGEAIRLLIAQSDATVRTHVGLACLIVLASALLLAVGPVLLKYAVDRFGEGGAAVFAHFFPPTILLILLASHRDGLRQQEQRGEGYKVMDYVMADAGAGGLDMAGAERAMREGRSAHEVLDALQGRQ